MKKLLSIILIASMLLLVTGVSVASASVGYESRSSYYEDIPTPMVTSEGSDLTIETTESVTLPEGAFFIYFDVKSSGWSDVKRMFCHIFRPDGKGQSHAWQSKKELCTYDDSTGIATYDLSKLNFAVTPDDGKEYCVLFSADTGIQTYSTVMSGNCIGDTMYCTGEQIENPENEGYKSNVATWRNNSDCGPRIAITSTGNIVGNTYPDGESNATLIADFLIRYYYDYSKTDFTKQLLKELDVSPTDVMAEVRKRVGSNDIDGKVQAIEKILAPLDAPTKPIECDLNDDGYTNIIDATFIQKYAAELVAFTSSQCKIADINSDGVVNVVDTTLIQKRLAGI